MPNKSTDYVYVLTTLVQTPYERKFDTWSEVNKYLEWSGLSLGWLSHHSVLCNMRTCAKKHQRAIVESNELVHTHTLEKVAL